MGPAAVDGSLLHSHGTADAERVTWLTLAHWVWEQSNGTSIKLIYSLSK